MKIKPSNIIKFITVFLFATITCNATDLVVRDGGAGGVYATISAAITAAADGDRIIIRPKVSGVPYIEDLTINKSLTFVSEIHGDKYEVQGSVIITFPSDKTITFHDLNLVGDNNIYHSGSSTIASGTRAIVNIMNCTITGNINFREEGVTINVFGSSFDRLEMLHGKIIANEGRSIFINYDANNLVVGQDVYIIANKLTNGFLICRSSYNTHIYNNFLKTNSSSEEPLIFWSAEAVSYMVVNNYIETTSIFSDAVNMSSVTGASTSVSMINNIINAQSSSYFEVKIGSTTPFIQLINNMSPTDFRAGPVDINTNNTGNATLSTTDFLTTGDNVNAGAVDTSYTDIDLTVNDIGPHGGSFTWANFWTGEVQKPHIYFLNTPRAIFNGTTTFEVNGIGTTN